MNPLLGANIPVPVHLNVERHPSLGIAILADLHHAYSVIYKLQMSIQAKKKTGPEGPVSTVFSRDQIDRQTYFISI